MVTILTIAQAVKADRKQQGLTQQQLGELAGTGLNFISQLERGKETVRLDKVLAVLKVLGLRIQVTRNQEVGLGSRKDVE